MNTLKMEMYKLYKRKSTKRLLMLYGIVMTLLSLGYIFGELNLGINILTSGQFIITSLSTTMAFFLSFISLYIASTSFALDYSSGSIKNMFLLPVTKQEVYIGKLLSVQSLMGILLMIQFIFSGVVALFLDGGFSMSVFGTALMHYMGAFVILGLVNLSGALLALLFSSTGLVVLVSYMAYLGMGILRIYMPQLRGVILSDVLGNYKNIFMNLNLSVLLSVIAYYIILVLVGNLLFEKKEASVCQFE